MLAVVAVLSVIASAVASPAAPPPPPQVLVFSFDVAFGDNMVRQQAPARSAVYGFLDFASSAAGDAVVHVTLTPADGGAPTTVQAALNTTVQTFGPDWGVRSLNASECSGCLPPFNPFNSPLASWKALLPPQAAGGNFTVTAVCTGCSEGAPSTVSISNVAFGDIWLVLLLGSLAALALALALALADRTLYPCSRSRSRSR